MVWRAGYELDQALAREAVSQVAASRVNDMQAALWEARLRLAEYLRSADIASRRSLERAIDRLQVAAGAPGPDGPTLLTSRVIRVAASTRPMHRTPSLTAVEIWLSTAHSTPP
jgi:hypothetical protein